MRDRGARQTTPGPEHYRMALEAGRMGTWSWDSASGRLEWDPALERVFGIDPGSFGGTMEDYLARLHPGDVAATAAAISDSIETGQSHYIEHRVMLPDGGIRWVSGSGARVTDDDGNTVGMVGVGADITEQRNTQDARQAAEAASEIARDAVHKSQARLALLGRISGVLGGSLDVDTTLQQVADLVVGEHLADWCVVQLPGGPGQVSQVALAHRDPAMIQMAQRLQEEYPPQLTDEAGLGKVMRTGAPEFWPTVPRELVEASARDDAHRELLLSLELTAAMVIPLPAGGRVLGAMTLIGSHGRSFDDDDLEAAVQMGVRAGVALDNANVYAERDRVASTLQRSLLPPALPTVPGFDVAAHYRPGSAAHGIGGDFYDVFPAGTRSWRVVVGDVCGKGVDAAALTTAVRYALRTGAVLTESPADVLELVNETLLHDDWGERFATVTLVNLDLTDDGTRITVASGGHPSPLLRRADGTVERLAADGMLLGTLPEATFSQTETLLGDGDCLLLYTDGATEAGRPPDLFGDERLTRALAAAPADRAASVVEAVAGEVDGFVAASAADPGGRDGGADDLALVALLVR